MSRESFDGASRAAESWINTVGLVAKLGERGSVDAAYRLLLSPADEPNWPNLLESFNQHGGTLRDAFRDLASLSDGPIKWRHGRGRSAIANRPELVFPHVWSSAHEAAYGIAELAIDLLVAPLEGINDLQEQTSAGQQLLSSRWQALVVSVDEVTSLQERIRRERAKLSNRGDEPPQEDHPQESLRDNEYTILRVLRDALPRRLVVTDLAEQTAITRKPCGQILAQLSERGLADKHPSGPC